MIKKYSITHFLFDVNKTSVPHKFKKVWEGEKFALLEVNISE